MLLCVLLLVGSVAMESVIPENCSNVKYTGIPNPAPEPDATAPTRFTIEMGTNVSTINPIFGGKPRYEPITIEIFREWAPYGADRIFSLVADRYFNNAAFYRVVPDFVIQFGIAAEPEETSKWNTGIKDDPVKLSNLPWTVSYAMEMNDDGQVVPQSRTTNIFVNLVNNSRLDAMGFAPFGRVISGFDTLTNITNPTPGDAGGMNQTEYELKGNAWALQAFPNVSIVTCAHLDADPFVDEDDDDSQDNTVVNILFVVGSTLASLSVIGFLWWYSQYKVFGSPAQEPLLEGEYSTMSPMMK